MTSQEITNIVELTNKKGVAYFWGRNPDGSNVFSFTRDFEDTWGQEEEDRINSHEVTDPTDKVTITLSEERPMRVSEKTWPLVAKASLNSDHNNQELARRYYLRVRIHAIETKSDEAAINYYGVDCGTLAAHPDRKAVVYGWHDSSHQHERGIQSGYRCTLDTCPALIRRVGTSIGADESLIMECIGDLPPAEEEDASALSDLSTAILEAEIARRKGA